MPYLPVFAATLLATVFASHDAALAQSQPFAAAPPGTRVHISNGRWYEIDSVEGNVVRTVGSNYGTLTWLGMCFPLSDDRNYDSRAVDSLWPLSLGKTAAFEFSAGERRWAVEFRVTGTERVTVPAGTFETITIEALEKALTHTYSGLYRCAYAPELGFLVRRTFELKEGSNRVEPAEAIKIEKADRANAAAFRPPPPGTVFDTTIGSYRIDAAEGTNLIRKSDQPNLNTIWVGGFLTFGSRDYAAEPIKRDLSKLWPLEVGKTVRFDVTRQDGAVWANSMKVERIENLKLPAGTYSTFVVSHQERAINGSYNASYTYWWSPALGFPIKKDVQFVSGTSAPRNYELRRVIPPQ